MHALVPALAAALALSASAAVTAAPAEVTLAVPGMNCPACPITIKKALGKVAGVAATKVDLDKRQATVRYDDARTTPEALMRATRDAGYPSTLVDGAK